MPRVLKRQFGERNGGQEQDVRLMGLLTIGGGVLLLLGNGQAAGLLSLLRHALRVFT